ncbi:MAG: gliding motility-associated C-terminal domain-containing protein, partial [Bacteroidetes bacterium]|nr:gliding motility-associated C-terminal domain-containing protein [Bacteroidota bacterium]
LWVEDANGCADTTSVLIRVKMYCDLYVPNAFTPGEDGSNDFFRPISSCDFLSYQLLIYDRWGEQIFSTKDPGESWDGTKDGIPVQQEVYVWMVRYQFQGGIGFKPTSKMGTVTVIL